MPAAAEAVVTFRNGLTLPIGVLRLAWDLEGRGAKFAVENRGETLVRPAALLTEADCVAIRRWKPDLLALVTYVDGVTV